MLAVLVTVCLIILVVVFRRYLAGKRERDAEEAAIGNWSVYLTDSIDNPKVSYCDYFPFDENDRIETWSMTPEQREDEAASLAMFVVFDQLENIKPGFIVCVIHRDYPNWYFQPDFHEGHLIGVKPLNNPYEKVGFKTIVQ